jgi:hypothetical protein
MICARYSVGGRGEIEESEHRFLGEKEARDGG